MPNWLIKASNKSIGINQSVEPFPFLVIAADFWSYSCMTKLKVYVRVTNGLGYGDSSASCMHAAVQVQQHIHSSKYVVVYG